MDRIWLKSYPPGVPAEIDPTQLRSLKELVEKTCEAYADRVAFVQMDAELTYRQVGELSRAFAAWLQHAGFAKGDRFAIMLPNTLQYPIALFGALRAGLIVVNTNPLSIPRPSSSISSVTPGRRGSWCSRTSRRWWKKCCRARASNACW